MARAARVAVLLSAVILALLACGAWLYLQGGLRGGELITLRPAVTPFSGLHIDGLADVTLRQGTTDAVAIEISARQSPDVSVDVVDGVLRIRYRTPRSWWSHLFGGAMRTPRIDITVRQLDTIALSGAVKLAAERLRVRQLGIDVSGTARIRMPELQAEELAITASGAMKATLAGSARRQRVVVTGAAEYRAGDLVTDETSIDVSGAGRVLVNAQKQLRVEVSGAGAVEYEGDPQLVKHVSGAARVHRRRAELDPGHGSA